MYVNLVNDLMELNKELFKWQNLCILFENVDAKEVIISIEQAKTLKEL